MVETEASMAATPCIEDWTQTPWRTLERQVYRLQKRIYQAQSRGKVAVVHSLQRLLMKSRAARTLAVRRVTQDNQGKKTAGVDGVKSVGPLTRLLFVEKLRTAHTNRAHPVRRVLIPKAGKPGEFRPLGIPVMLDRAHQALAKLALEPQWEARFEPNSYGFRPGRSCHDAIEAIFTSIRGQDKYVLDADIKGCFDNIAHKPLLDKLDTTPAIRRAVKGWLQAGMLAEGAFVPTPNGTPQGGIASPLLANIALHGMGDVVRRSYQRRSEKDTLIRPTLIRYADDLVVLCHDLAGILRAKEALAEWLAARGLHLSPTKTRITHTLHAHDGPAGFDFLGCTIRQFPVGITRRGKHGNGHRLGFKTLIKPSKEAINRHMASMGKIIRQYRGAPQAALIGVLNPIIRGWAAYYRTVVASAVFHSCDHLLFYQLQSWARHRHPKKNAAWVARRYWRMQPGTMWEFVVKEGGEIPHCLTTHGTTHIRRHVKVKGTASPFDGNLLYWAKRLKDHPLTGSTMGRLLVRQTGKCPHCALTFQDGDLLEIDHVEPTSIGGKDVSSNLQVLHRHCHDQKSAADCRRGYL